MIRSRSAPATASLLFEGEQWFALACRLSERAWTTGERPIVLFDLATHRLVEAKILLPGVTTLERLIAALRERVAARQYALLATAPSPNRAVVLEGLVKVEEGRRVLPKRGELAGTLNRHAYTVAAVERLRESLRRHEVFVPGLRKWGDPTAGLLKGAERERARSRICDELNLSAQSGDDVERWAATLDFAYRQMGRALRARHESPSGAGRRVCPAAQLTLQQGTGVDVRADAHPCPLLRQEVRATSSWSRPAARSGGR
ncbi:DUF4158 domain-containing protein [Streptosporangium roseum]|uniref:DUF4158 domain-containing protein n=1 Tax=Streptosporangium roseum TaxID=2001 RepID=UPI00331E8117